MDLIAQVPPNREMMRLRALLDERGIEHFDYDANKQEGKPILETQWHTEDVHATYVEYPNKGNTTRLVVAWHPTPEQAIAATVGNGTDLSKRLRKVTGLRSFAELFGFSWEDGSDWDWHDVACAMADAIDATVGVVPETKYLMALDEAREAQRKLEMCQTSQKVYQGKCRSLKETNADLRRIIDDMKAATVGTEPDEVTMLKLHDRMNAALLDYESAMGIEGGNGANTVPFVIEMHSLLEDAATMGAAGMCEGSFHESSDLSSGKVPLYYCKVTNKSIFIEREARFCPLCGKRIEVVSA